MDETIGTIKLFAGDYAPVGYLECDGSTLSISLYPLLYAAIGLAYGGDGGATFKLPDLRYVDPKDHTQKVWLPHKPRWVICNQGLPRVSA
jgi:microcystin-dependent protein